MSDFNVHTLGTAPDKSVKLLEAMKQSAGFIPNLLGVMAESPAVAEAYTTLGKIFSRTSLTPVEQQVTLLAINRYNECDYCMAAHSVIASAQKVPADVIQAIRDDQPVKDERLEALRLFATQVVDQRGWVQDADISAFLSAGYTHAQVLEVILAVSFKTLSNYTNHVAETPLDDAFAARAWTPVDKTAA